MNTNKFVKFSLVAVAANVLLILMLILGSSMAITQEEAPEEKPHWSYEGETGPETWAELSEEYAACAGEAQSPIDIANPTSVDLTDLEFNYQEVPLAIFNNGHTIEVEYAEGSTLTYNAITYNVLQFHFHAPSEHTIDGESFPMELHIVHKDPMTGNLAVVGVMLAEGEADNESYTILFDNLPPEEGEPMESDMTINVANLLPESAEYFTYNGSSPPRPVRRLCAGWC